MKRTKRLYILSGILALTCVATFAVTQMEETKEQIKTTGEIILQVPTENVQSLCWEYGSTSLSFHKDDTWLYDADTTFPVDEGKIQELLEPFEAFGTSFIIENVTDSSMYGLDTPECTIRFSTSEQEYTIELGDFSSMDDERYVSIGDGNVYLAKTDVLEQFQITLKDMIRHDKALSYKQISQIQLKGSENYTILYKKESPYSHYADDVYFVEKDNSTLPLDTVLVNSWLKKLTGLQLTDYVTYAVTEEELETFGLTAPELTITVDYSLSADAESYDTFVLAISQDPAELAAAEEAQANGKTANAVTTYVRIGESQIVYRIPEYSASSLKAVSYNDLRHREVLSTDFDSIRQIDISLDGSQYTITAETDSINKNDLVWTYQEEQIEIFSLQNTLENLSANDSSSFTSEAPSGKEEIRLLISLDDETRPQTDITLYRYNGEFCLATVDGESFALVPRSDVVDLVEAVHYIVLD